MTKQDFIREKAIVEIKLLLHDLFDVTAERLSQTNLVENLKDKIQLYMVKTGSEIFLLEKEIENLANISKVLKQRLTFNHIDRIFTASVKEQLKKAEQKHLQNVEKKAIYTDALDLLNQYKFNPISPETS